jgi:hypothetical protein
MASEQQVQANRINAQSTTGPKTPEGRAAVRLNGIKHGLTASTRQPKLALFCKKVAPIPDPPRNEINNIQQKSLEPRLRMICQ